jgi:hypothetical protein
LSSIVSPCPRYAENDSLSKKKNNGLIISYVCNFKKAIKKKCWKSVPNNQILRSDLLSHEYIFILPRHPLFSLNVCRENWIGGSYLGIQSFTQRWPGVMNEADVSALAVGMDGPKQDWLFNFKCFREIKPCSK